jgi:hypothetical protein
MSIYDLTRGKNIDLNVDSIVTSGGGRFGSPVSVTQITSDVTAVTCNSPKGIVTTFSLSDAAGASHSFIINNSYATVNHMAIVTFNSYGGTGIPIILLSAVGAGTIGVTIKNIDAIAALNAVGIISFQLV